MKKKQQDEPAAVKREDAPPAEPTPTERIDRIERMVAGGLGIHLEAHDLPEVKAARDEYHEALNAGEKAAAPKPLTVEERISRLERAMVTAGRL